MRLVFFILIIFWAISPHLAHSEGEESKSYGGAQEFEGFYIQGYGAEGEKTWDVKGDTAQILGNTIEIFKVDGNQYGSQLMNLKAQKGKVDRVTGNIHLETDVVMTSQDGGQFTTDFIDWKRSEDLVLTSAPVFLNHEQRGMKANGIGLWAKPGTKFARIEKDVTIKVRSEPANPHSSIVTITSNGPFEIFQDQNKARMTKNVVAVHEERTLTADQMDIYFDPKIKALKEIVCSGNVLILQGGSSTQSEKAIYTAATDKLELVGSPKLIMVDDGKMGMGDGLGMGDSTKN
ncbi:MAG: LPS export ABC transporter periplasmic protein LptC [Candidatus Omnitrophica bacterium]|nr:LPS export ABC transporter periplasmic protein LptC [Candidatus Omnitrophota bacterium]